MLKHLQQRVQNLRLVAHDPEVAHQEEDDIRDSALRWIAEHSTDDQAVNVANEALNTGAIKFPRWCA